MFLELMKNNVLPSSEFSILILFSLTESDHYRSSVYSMLLSQLLYEFDIFLEPTYYQKCFIEHGVGNSYNIEYHVDRAKWV